MTHFHAVLIDETGCEFGAGVEAKDKLIASQMLREMYPECRIDQIESPQDTEQREQEMYRRLDAEYYNDWCYEEEWD